MRHVSTALDAPSHRLLVITRIHDSVKPLVTLCLASLLLFAARAPAASGEKSVALLPLETTGAGKEMRERLESLLRQEMERLPGLDVMSESDTHIRLAKRKAGCRFDDLACLASAGATVSVQKVVRARVAKASSGFDLELKVVDVPARVEEGRLKEHLDEAPHAHAVTVRRMVTQLLVPEQFVGSLLLSVDEPGARVFIDGVDKGVTPLAGPIAGLPPGKHLLELRVTGKPPLSRFVVIQFGEVTTEKLSFAAAATGNGASTASSSTGNGTASPTEVSSEVQVPVTEPKGIDESDLLWFGAGGAVAGLGVVALGGAGITGAVTALQPNLPPDATDKQIRDAVEQRRLLWTTTWILAGAGLLAVAAGGTLSALPLVLEE